MLSNKYRLRLQRDFDRVYKQGRSLSGPLFNLRFASNTLKHSRFAFVISKKVEPKVTKRNVVKRRARAVIGKLISLISPKFDIVVFIKKPALGADFKHITLEIETMLRKAKLLTA